MESLIDQNLFFSLAFLFVNLSFFGLVFILLRKRIRAVMKRVSLIDRKVSGFKNLSAEGRSAAKKAERMNLKRAVSEAIRDLPPGKRIIVILSLPKCGGCSLQATLSATFTGDFTAHVHVWTRDGMEHLIESEKDRGDFGRDVTLRHIDTAARLRDYLLVAPRADSWWFCGVREPISYALSLFFEMQVTYPGVRSEYGVSEIREYIESGQGFFGDVRRLDEWFETEFFTATGIDVFASPFDTRRGYSVVKRETKRACVYRMEFFDGINRAIAETFDIPLSIVRSGVANRAVDKDYADRYHEAIRTIRFSREFLGEVYQTRYARHFFTDEERLRFKAKWSC